MTEADDRKRRRQSHASARKAERQRAVELSEALKEPPPSEAVLQAQARAGRERQAAERQRDLARLAVSPAKRREFVANARRAEDRAKRALREAASAREQQLAEHWAGSAIAESERLDGLRASQGEGEAMTDAATAVQEWVRDEYGALVRDENGMPKLRTEMAKPKRRRGGLESLRKRDAISPHGYDTALWYGQLCANVAMALHTGREETGLPASPACKPSAGLADWKTGAIAELAAADAFLIRSLGIADGSKMTQLLVAVCFDGASCHYLAEGDVEATAKLESRIATGLAMLRHHRIIRAKELRRRDAAA